MDFLLPAYNWFKALHILSVIAWMAAMMYLPRLFIYHHQSEKGGEAEKLFMKMEERLSKGIMSPAMGATWLFGILMIAAVPAYAMTGWFIVKFIFVLAMSGVHGFYVANRKKFGAGERPRTEKFWRIMNEVPFLFLIIIVFMVVLKAF